MAIERAMNLSACPVRSVLGHHARRTLRASSWPRHAAMRPSFWSSHRCLSHSIRRLTVEAAAAQGEQNLARPSFWKDYKETFNVPPPTFRFDPQISLDEVKSEKLVTAVGFVKKIVTLAENLYFAQLNGGSGPEGVQIICQDRALCKKLGDIRINSPVSITGHLGLKREPKKRLPLSTDQPDTGFTLLRQVEIKATAITCLNTIPLDIHPTSDHVFPPQSRHLQIRFDLHLRNRLLFRSELASYVRERLKGFHEIETPILFKSTPEGAREFLVPTRKIGYSYALPQSPQQYKQILMASGIDRYFQFARCFRDEDLRADRQPEFTQIDLEMAFTDGNGVMNIVENLIKDLYKKFAKSGTGIQQPIEAPLPDEPFVRIPYKEAMSKYGSDKPDLRIFSLIHRIDHLVPKDLVGMLTSIKDPIIEACRFKLNADAKDVQDFVRKFMDSPDAESFRLNVDGAPGFSIYDSRRPLEGLQTLGFEGAREVKSLYAGLPRSPTDDDETHEMKTTFADGDLLIIQARGNLPFSGGSTMLGKLRLAIYKAALAEGLIEPDLRHHYLWVVDFPMFTLENETDPGQGGAAGFSATHHPFTAPKSGSDLNLLLTDPLTPKADHYDLVVNGVELGGGSKRIHNAEMQKFIMSDILKMSEERLKDFSHLFEALRAGCPPHAGFAIGFDRLVAVMTGRESVKDVIAFPKSSKGEDMLVKSPARITDAELARYHLQFAKPIPESKHNSDPIPEENVDEIVTQPPSKA